ALEEVISRRMGPEFIEHLVNPRHLLALIERHPEGAVTYLRTLRELGFGRALEEVFSRRVDPEFIERFSNPAQIRIRIETNIHSLSLLLFVTRQIHSKPAINTLSNTLTNLLQNRADFRSYLSSLSIASIHDLRWLAEQSRSTELQSLIMELI